MKQDTSVIYPLAGRLFHAGVIWPVRRGRLQASVIFPIAGGGSKPLWYYPLASWLASVIYFPFAGLGPCTTGWPVFKVLSRSPGWDPVQQVDPYKKVLYSRSRGRDPVLQVDPCENTLSVIFPIAGKGPCSAGWPVLNYVIPSTGMGPCTLQVDPFYKQVLRKVEVRVKRRVKGTGTEEAAN